MGLENWRPIETAPTGKNVRILAYSDWAGIHVAEWEFAGLPGWRLIEDGEGSGATHWMPLPERPH